MELHLKEMPVDDFLNALGSDTPAPGGGAASGLSGALAAALGKMVADLTIKRKKYEQYHELAKDASSALAILIDDFRTLSEEDTKAYMRYSEAIALPKNNEEEIEKRKSALNQAILYSTEVPCRVIDKAMETVKTLEMLYGKSNKTCMGDLAAAAEELNTACKLAWLNVLANLPYLPDPKDAHRIMKEKRSLLDEIQSRCSDLYSKVENDILNSFVN